MFYNTVLNNLINLNVFNLKNHAVYDKSKIDNIKFKFKDIDIIEQNYSEAYQDMFILAASDGKKDGTYVEIGSANPVDKNNTYLLETKFNWNGISLGTKEEFVKEYSDKRKNKCLLKDPAIVDYNKFLNGVMPENVIDYLQISIDNIETAYKVLLSMPFDTKKFGIITFKHNRYNNKTDDTYKSVQSFLCSYGYELLVNNISANDHTPYEDWFVHPSIISEDNIIKLKNIGEKTKNAEKYMFGEI